MTRFIFVRLWSIIDRKEMRRNTMSLEDRRSVGQSLKLFVRRKRNIIEKPFLNPFNEDEYHVWIENVERAGKKKKNNKLGFRPLVSLLLDVRCVKGKDLKRSIDSVMLQKYDNLKLYVVMDASEAKRVERILNKYGNEKKVELIRCDKGEGVAQVFNKIIKNIRDGFCGFVSGGDLLARDAIPEMIEASGEGEEADLIYSDEDKINRRGERYDPHFKPDFSPDTLLGFNYIGHLTLVRAKMMHEVGDLNEKLRFAWDYDLYLRVCEKSKYIKHVSEILYHRNIGVRDAKMTALEDDENIKVIREALKRRGKKAEVRKSEGSDGYYDVVYDVKEESLVSIIIPIKDQAETTEVCLKSIYGKTEYKNYEVIIVNNRSEEDKTFKLLDKYQKKYKNFYVVDADMEFNYPAINNLAVKKARGKFVVLMNNDIEVISRDWLKRMVGFAIQSHVGAVGVELWYRDKKIQHAGVVLGLGASRVAGHAYHNLSEAEVKTYGRLYVPYNYSAVTAACLCIEKKKYDDVGGMGEELAVAFNDVDLNVKLLENGYYNVLLPMVKMFHDESKSRGLDVLPEKQERFIREMNLMKVKWKNVLLNDRFYNKNFSLDLSFMLKGKEKND